MRLRGADQLVADVAPCVVQIDDLRILVLGLDVVDFDALKAAGLIETRAERAKIVKKGELTRAIKVRGVAVTAGARAAIEAAGGSIE